VLGDTGVTPTGKPGVIRVDTSGAIDAPDIISPLRMDSKMGIFKDLPKMAADSDSDVEDEGESTPWETKVPTQVVAAIKKLQQKVKNVGTLWAPMFQEVEMAYVEVVEDIKKLQQYGKQMQTSIGEPGSTTARQPLWRIVTELQAKVKNGAELMEECQITVADSRDAVTQARTEFLETQSAIEEIKDWLTGHGRRMDAVESILEVYGKMMENMRPGLKLVKELVDLSRAGSTAGGNAKLTEQVVQLQKELPDVKKKVDNADEAAWNMLAPDGRDAGTFDADMRDVKAKLVLLEQRVVGEGVQMGTKVFQCFEDMRTWTITGLPNGRYGLFVDGVSLLDFFAFTGFTESEKSIAAMHNSQKTGFTTMYEARAAATLQNVFPLILGKNYAGGMDDS